MRVQIAARHCEVPDTVRDRAVSQVRKLDKYEPRISSAEIVFEEERHTKKVEGILSVDGDEPVVASGGGRDFRAAVEQMADRLGRQLRRRRSQRTDHQGGRTTPVERTLGD